MPHRRLRFRLHTHLLTGFLMLSAALGPSGCKKKASPATGNAGDTAASETAGTTKPAAVKTPPSTGKEAPRASVPLPTAAEAKAGLDAALAAAQKPGHDCAQAISPKTRVYLGIANPTPAQIKANLPAFVALARCAEARSYFAFMRDLSLKMVQADEVNGHPELLARALFGLHLVEPALSVLNVAIKKNPKDANVAVTAAKVTCHLGRWDDCRKLSDAAFTLSQLEKDAAEKQAIATRAKKYLARSLLHAGKIDDAAKAADDEEKLGGDKKDVEELRQELVPARNFHALVDVELEHELDLGTYHLLGKAKGVGPLAHVTVDNIDTEDKQFRVEVEVNGVTQRTSKTLTIIKGKSQSVDVTPPIKTDFNVSSTRANQTGQVSVKVTSIGASGEKVVYDQSLPISVQPRDQLPLARFTDQEKLMGAKTPGFIGAWVTPNAKPVDAFLADAKKRAPNATFSGEQSATVPQVKALYDELQARGVSYVMDPAVASEDTHSQRTRLPAEVLASGNAQCIEGAILYATLLEAIGIKPSVILVPGHAFVGWKPAPKDSVKSDLVYLETTMTHSAPFEKALDYAAREFAEHSKNKVATVVDIPQLRSLGFTPQPYD